MRNRICLAAALFVALAGSPAPAQTRSGPPMERKVSVTFHDAPLESVLRTLHQQYGVRISYSNTALNLRQRVTLNVQNQPLRVVLDEVLRDRNIGYELVGDQVVLHPATPKKPAAKKPGTAAPVATSSTTITVSEVSKDSPAAGGPPTRPQPAVKETEGPVRATPKPNPAPASKPKSAKPTQGKAASQPAPRPQAADKEVTASATETTAVEPRPSPNATASVSAGGLAPFDSAAVTAPLAARDTVAALPAAPTEEPAVIKKTAQISFLWPLGSNGVHSGQTVNKVSINVLGGYSAGVDGFEAASLINVTRDSVRGVQVAGLGNLVGHHLEGVQAAGLFNVLGGGGQGGQAAGLFNVATRPIAGVQAAGLFNYTGPRKNKPDAAGLVPELPKGGLVQAAGLFNASLVEVRGTQIAGLFNVAGTVHGVQLAGLFNVADSVDGVSLAPLNFVRRGYHRFEVTSSEAWPISPSVKLGGSAAFYTYFTGGLDPFKGNNLRWAVGYGAGSEFFARHRFSLSLDALAMQVNEENGGAWTNDLNLHNQLRLLVGFAPFRPAGHMRIVAGPVLNLLVTERYDTERGGIYSSVGQGRSPSWLKDESGNTHLYGWVGYSVGLRF